MIKDIVNGLIETYKTSNPFEICDCLNIKIICSNLGNEIKGFFQRTQNGYEIIHINSVLNGYDSKYICAHELGHAIMHTDVSVRFFVENSLLIKNKYEIQADRFAAELLVPDAQDMSEIKDMNTFQLSLYYGVPEQLIKYKFNID